MEPNQRLPHARATTTDGGLTLIEVSRIYPAVTPVVALTATSLHIESGEMIGVTGRSGSGKSTLLNLLGLLDKPSTGRYEVDGVNTGSLSEIELTALRAWHFGFIFQDYHLLPDRTAQENVELALAYRRCPAKERRMRAARALASVEMSHRKDAFPNTLSGGEAQRVAIARAIVHEPRVLLCDEPTGNLDSTRSGLVMDILYTMAREGLTVVIATHDDLIAKTLPRCLRLEDGRVTDLVQRSPESSSQENFGERR
jgi:putative ABC transport system ATP-binding protein